MPDARAAAMLLKQIGRVGHALHPARDNIIDRASGQRFAAHDNGLHTRTAHFVDCGRLHRFGQACLDRRLARGGLAQTCG